MVTQQQKAKETKERLMQAAFGLLKTEPFNALTASKITTAAGVSKGGFFHHFSTLEDFYFFMLDSFIQSIGGEIVQNQSEDLEAFLKISMEFTLDMVDKSPEILTFIYSIMDMARLNPIYADKIREIMEKGFDKWKTDFAQYFPPGLSQESQDKVIYLIDMYMMGLSAHFMFMKNRDRYIAITQDFISMLINHINKVMP